MVGVEDEKVPVDGWVEWWVCEVKAEVGRIESGKKEVLSGDKT